MSSTEDRARAAMRAIAATVNDAPPLQLSPAQEPERAPDETGPAGDGPRLPGAARPGKFRSGGRGLHHPGGTAGPSGRGHDRRWRSWLAPVTAAAVVVALAIALVLVKDLPNGGAVSGNPTPSTGPGGAPRYYVAIKTFAVKGSVTKLGPAYATGIVVGDSLTGKTLATFAPPPDTTFVTVSAAADDKTFVVSAVTSSSGSFNRLKGVMLTGSWYAVRLAPGTADPARLSRLPIKPLSWAGTDNTYANPTPGQIYDTALSESGRELAIAEIPHIPAADGNPSNWQEVKVFSVATGRLLRDWTSNDPNARFMTVLSGAGVPGATPVLTWVDGDQALAVATFLDRGGKVSGAVRRLNVAGPTSGNLMADSTVTWSGTLPWNQSKGCFNVNDWPPLISADGNTISCVTEDSPSPSLRRISFDTDPLGGLSAVKPRRDYQVTAPKLFVGPLSILWTSPSGDTLIGVWQTYGGPQHAPATLYIGVIGHGKFTPLRLPSSLHATASLQPGAMAW